jgi:AN1-type zinc finger protein 2
MEFVNVGSHCAVPSCNLHDFLPFTCARCQVVVCKDHAAEAYHGCKNPSPDGHTIECPLCSQLVAVNASADPNEVMTKHIDNRCRAPKSTLKSGCRFPKCKLKSVALIDCQLCRQQFCLKHRLREDHDCDKMRSCGPQPRNNVSSITRLFRLLSS